MQIKRRIVPESRKGQTGGETLANVHQGKGQKTQTTSLKTTQRREWVAWAGTRPGQGGIAPERPDTVILRMIPAKERSPEETEGN